MMRCHRFRYASPATLREACERMQDAGGEAMLLAGGTDLVPNMKRRQQVPPTVISLRRVRELRDADVYDGMVRIGAMTTLASLTTDPLLRERHPALFKAAAQVATPHLRNMGTLGGNLCLDTRCNYYDQNYEWRKAIDFCMKKDGETCWVATSSPRCLAVSSTDTAPMLMALGAEVTLVSADRTRRIGLSELYRNDGIHYLTRQPGEILTAVHLPRLDGWRSTYWKLRRRGSFDFPVLSVGAALKLSSAGVVEGGRTVLGAVASRPVDVPAAAIDALVGRPLSDESIAAAASAAAQPAKPMDNTDFS